MHAEKSVTRGSRPQHWARRRADGVGGVWLARHGERQDAMDAQRGGPGALADDPPLSEEGKRQAALLAGRLRDEGLSHVVASPYRRTVETAAIVARACKLPVKLEPGVCELLDAHLVSGQPVWQSPDVMTPW